MSIGARKPVLPVIAVCCVFTGWLVWATVPALAGSGFAPISSFSPPQGFSDPSGLAVDDTAGLSKGDVYVADQGDDKLEKFSATGVLLGEVEVPGAQLNKLTVEQYPNLAYEGDVYVVGSSSGVVYRFGPELALKQEIKGISNPIGVAVDEVGDVLISSAQDGGKVSEFNAAGEPVNATGAPDPDNTVLDGITPNALAVDASGKVLYAANGTYGGGAIRYVSVGGTYVQEAELEYASRWLKTSRALGVTLTSAGSVLVNSQLQIIEYGSSGTARLGESELEVGSHGFISPVLSEAQAIGVNDELGYVYVADSAKDLVYAFEEGPTPEVPETTSPSGVGSSTVTLNGILKRGSGDGETSGYYFSYKLGSSCEKYADTPELGPTASTVGKEGEVQAEVSELSYATQYTFCLVATNKYGTTFGPPISFNTASIPPRIENESPANVGTSSVNLTLHANPGGSPTTYHFEYGPTSAYGLSTPEMALGTGIESILGTARLTGLAPNTQYHYRVVASNEKGSEDGSDASFTTFASVFHGLPDGRVYEQVSRQENQERSISFPQASGALDGAGFDGFSTDLPFQPSLNGNAVVYGGEPSSPGGTGNGGLGESNQYLATRNADGGWSQVNLQPPGYHNAYYQAFSRELSTGVLTAESEGEGGINYLPPLTPSAPVGVKVLYSRTLGEEGYRPLFTVTPPSREIGGSAYNQPGKALEAFRCSR